MANSNPVSKLARYASLRQLQVFEAVARLGSFTRAAEELFLAQPTVSMQLKKLADTIELPLFEQVGIRIQLTDAGREVYVVCQEVFHSLACLEMKIADLKGIKRGHLRLAVITSAKYLAHISLASSVGCTRASISPSKSPTASGCLSALPGTRTISTSSASRRKRLKSMLFRWSQTHWW